LRFADQRQQSRGFVQFGIDKARALRQGIRTMVAGGSAVRNRAFGSEPSRRSGMLAQKNHDGP
jgi:hypothetical protein